MSEQDGSQTVETQQEQGSVDVAKILTEQFGIAEQELKAETAPEQETKEEPELEGEEIADPPAKEEKTNEPKTHRVKHNKDEVEVDISTDEKLTDHLQRSLALDKVREQAKQREADLNRAAIFLGFKDHAELTANFDKIEQDRKKKQDDDNENLRLDMIAEFQENGGDPAKLEQWLETHPLLNQAQQAVTQLEKHQSELKLSDQRSALEKQWEELFVKHPALSKSEDEAWITPEMDSLLKQGYHPLHAYELTNQDKIRAEEKQRIEQDVIKQQRLNKRAKVIGNAAVETEDDAPDDVKNAFAMFGMDPKLAKKFMKK